MTEKMTDQHSFRGLLHRATHRVPGVPAHAERPSGHQGRVRHGCARGHSLTHHRSSDHPMNHTPARPPRVLAAWQRRVAAFFGQDFPGQDSFSQDL
jgi:hypothetical protein